MLAMGLAQAEVGNRIRQARKGKRWKQKHLAAAVHVEPVTVSRWERGVSTPDLDMLEVIAEETGKPLSFFVSAEGERSMDADLSDELARRHDEILRRFDSVDEQLRALVATSSLPRA